MSDRLDRVEALLAELTTENTQLKHEVAALKRGQAAPPQSNEPLSRRQLLGRLGTAAAAGAGLATGASLLGAQPAGAVVNNLVLNNNDDVTNVGSAQTRLKAGAGFTGILLNADASHASNETAIGLQATGSGPNVGVYGVGGAADGVGVKGDGGGTTGMGGDFKGGSNGGAGLRALGGQGGTGGTGIGAFIVGGGTSSGPTGERGVVTFGGAGATQGGHGTFSFGGDSNSATTPGSGGDGGKFAGGIGNFGGSSGAGVTADGGDAGSDGTGANPSTPGAGARLAGGAGVQGAPGVYLLGGFGTAKNGGVGLDIQGGGSSAGAASQGSLMRLNPSFSIVGPPTAEFRFAGEVWLDKNSDLYICTKGGTPGTWRRVATAAPAYNNAATGTDAGKRAGAVNILPTPIRIFDTRSPASTYPAPAPATRTKLLAATGTAGRADVQITGVTVDGITVPTGALAVIGTLSVVFTSDPGISGAGYLSCYASGAPPVHPTASITWFGPNQVLSTQATCPLSTSGFISIHNGMLGGSAATDVVFDVVGFVM
jgi:hypothetical protein